MLINFNNISEPKMPGGTGEMSAKMYMDEHGKIIPCRINSGGSIGIHTYSPYFSIE